MFTLVALAQAIFRVASLSAFSTLAAGVLASLRGAISSLDIGRLFCEVPAFVAVFQPQSPLRVLSVDPLEGAFLTTTFVRVPAVDGYSATMRLREVFLTIKRVDVEEKPFLVRRCPGCRRTHSADVEYCPECNFRLIEVDRDQLAGEEHQGPDGQGPKAVSSFQFRIRRSRFLATPGRKGRVDVREKSSGYVWVSIESHHSLLFLALEAVFWPLLLLALCPLAVLVWAFVYLPVLSLLAVFWVFLWLVFFLWVI